MARQEESSISFYKKEIEKCKREIYLSQLEKYKDRVVSQIQEASEFQEEVREAEQTVENSLQQSNLSNREKLQAILSKGSSNLIRKYQLSES